MTWWTRSRWRHPDLWGWLDIVQTVLIITFIAIGIALFILLLLGWAPSQASAGDITNHRTARRLAAVVVRTEKVTTRYSEPVRILYMEVSAYSPTAAECDAAPLITASGQRVRVGGIAADLRVLPFGSIVIIPNYNNGNPCTVVDTGSAIVGNKLDVFMWSTDAAVHWGRRRNVPVRVLYIPKETT